MKKIIAFALSAFLMLFNLGAYGQTLQSGFFLDNWVYGYRLNPALVSDKSFVSIGIGDVSATLSSDLSIGSILFKTSDGGLVTGLHPSVSSKEFLGNLKNRNSLNLKLNENILSCGFWKGDEKFTNIEVNLRAYGNAGLPKDLFAFLKDGSEDGTFNLSGVNVTTKAFAEIAFGQTYLKDRLTIGWRAKGLIGLASAGIRVRNADIQINQDVISYDIDADVYAAVNGLTVGTTVSKNTGNTIIDPGKMEFNVSSLSPSGFGIAFDFGATYKLNDMFTLSASVTDLGAISWNNNFFAQTTGAQSFHGIEGINLESEDFGEELEGALERLKDLGEFVPTGHHRTLNLLPVNACIGVKASPVKLLTAGYIGSFSFGGGTGFRTDHRIGAGVTPVKWLSFASNVGVSSYGKVWGAGLAVNVAGLNIHAGLDGYLGRMAAISAVESELPVDISIPIDAFNFTGNLGITLTFGKRHNI